MEIKIYTGNYEVIGSGTVVGNYDTPIEFIISSLTFIFEFKNDSTLTEPKIEKEQFNNGKSLKLKYINFNNVLGHGTAVPIALGTVSNRKLFLNYRVYALTESTGKTFHYTFLLEKEASNGK
jgi:hypothetical protein